MVKLKSSLLDICVVSPIQVIRLVHISYVQFIILLQCKLLVGYIEWFHWYFRVAGGQSRIFDHFCLTIKDSISQY
jgi:hypothetical protein